MLALQPEWITKYSYARYYACKAHYDVLSEMADLAQGTHRFVAEAMTMTFGEVYSEDDVYVLVGGEPTDPALREFVQTFLSVSYTIWPSPRTVPADRQALIDAANVAIAEGLSAEWIGFVLEFLLGECDQQEKGRHALRCHLAVNEYLQTVSLPDDPDRFLHWPSQPNLPTVVRAYIDAMVNLIAGTGDYKELPPKSYWPFDDSLKLHILPVNSELAMGVVTTKGVIWLNYQP